VHFRWRVPSEGVRDWGSKLVGVTARLAAVLHCVSTLVQCVGVEPDTIQARWRLAAT